MRCAVLAAAVLACLGMGSGTLPGPFPAAMAAAAQADGDAAKAPRTGWPMLAIPDMPANGPGARVDMTRIIADFERVCLTSRFDRGRIAEDEALVYAPLSVASPKGERRNLHVWRASNRAVQLASIDDQGMGSQCTFTVTTSQPVDVKQVHAAMTSRFGEQRNYRDDQAAFRTADGRFSPDWIAYRANWLGAGDPDRPRIVLLAQSFDGTGALARSHGVHLIAAELNE